MERLKINLLVDFLRCVWTDELFSLGYINDSVFPFQLNLDSGAPVQPTPEQQGLVTRVRHSPTTLSYIRELSTTPELHKTGRR